MATLVGNARVLAILAWLIITAAAYIRVYDLGDRSLWHDEAWLANAVSEHSLRGVMASIRCTPPLFAVAVHYTISWLRNNEFTLRLLPCGFGIGSVILIFFLTRKLSNLKAALLALIPFAFAPKLVYSTKEFKQYSGDMFFAILLVFLTERIIHRHSFKNWILFVVFASVGLWFSHPMTFVVPGLALILLYHSLTTGKDGSVLKHWFAAHLVIGVVWLALFFLIVQHQIIPWLVAFWQAYFPDTSSSQSLYLWLVKSSFNILVFGFGNNTWLALILIPVGLHEFFRKKCKRFLVYVLFPLLLTLAASFLHRYPYGGGKVMLFAFPLLFIAFGQGLFWALSTLYRKRYFAAMLVIALLIGLPAGREIYNNLTKPVRREEMRPLVEYLKQNLRPDDRIYVYYRAKPAFKYYYQGNYKNVTLGKSHRDDITKYGPEIEKILKRNIRIWIVFSHRSWMFRHEFDQEKVFFLSYLSKKGTLLDSFETTGTAAYLYEGTSAYLYKIHTPEGTTSSEYPCLGFLENFHRYSQVVSLAVGERLATLGSDL